MLAKKGYDPVLGARPLRRTIQRDIQDVLSEKILYGEIKSGELVLVSADGPRARRGRSPSWAPRTRRLPTRRRRTPSRSWTDRRTADRPRSAAGSRTGRGRVHRTGLRRRYDARR